MHDLHHSAVAAEKVQTRRVLRQLLHGVVLQDLEELEPQGQHDFPVLEHLQALVGVLELQFHVPTVDLVQLLHQQVGRNDVQLTLGGLADVLGHERTYEADALVLDLRDHPGLHDFVPVEIHAQGGGKAARDLADAAELVLDGCAHNHVAGGGFELEVLDHGEEELLLEELVLILSAGSLHELPNRREALTNQAVVLQVDQLLVLLRLRPEDLPDALHDVEAGLRAETGQEELVVLEVALAQSDEEVEDGELGLLLQPAVPPHLLDAVVDLFGLVGDAVVELDGVEQGFDLHEELDGVGLAGEVLVEDVLDAPVAILADQLVEELNTEQEELLVVFVQNAHLEEVQDGEDELGLTDLHSQGALGLLLLLLRLALEPQHKELHEQAQRVVHLRGGFVGQLLEGVFQKLGQFPQEQEDSHVDLLQHLQNVLNSLLLIFFKSYVVLLIVNMLQQQ